MSKHTPGPWAVVGDEEDGYTVRAGLYLVCEVPNASRRAENAANARLIAAAPDLLQALVEITPPMPPADAPCHVGLVPQERCGHCSRIARARAAIDKAEGA